MIAGWVVALLAACVVVFAAGPSRSQTSDSELFFELLKSPGDIGLNLRYARRAEEQQRLERAKAVYERILLLDPDNREAQAGLKRVTALAKPSATDVVVLVGGQYQTNSGRLDEARRDEPDTVGTATVVVEDDRRIGARRWHSQAQAFANRHSDFKAGDVVLVSADTGPSLAVSDNWTARPGVGLGFATLDSAALFAEYTGHLDLTTDLAPLKRIEAVVGYDDYRGRFEPRDAWIAGLEPRFEWRGLAADGDLFAVRPRYRFNGAESAESRFHNVRLVASYRRHLVGPFMGEVQAGAGYSAYAGAPAGESDEREDIDLVPVARLLWTNFGRPDLTLIGTYRFERKLSNIAKFDSKTHSVGLELAWTY